MRLIPVPGLRAAVFCSLFLGGCSLFLDDCGGAEGLDPEHAQTLECAGWLDLVVSNVTEVIYLDVESFQSNGIDALGAARCRSCVVSVARKGHSSFEVAQTLVHEATHLRDDCDHGELLAELAEIEFEADYRANACSR
jgi:hypothetical protein